MLAEWSALRPLGFPRDTHTMRLVSSVIHLCKSCEAEQASESDISSRQAPSLRAYSCMANVVVVTLHVESLDVHLWFTGHDLEIERLAVRGTCQSASLMAHT